MEAASFETELIHYEKDIIIDPNCLDVEWLEQPSLMMKYGKIAAQTKVDMDMTKERLEVVKAELDKNIRLNPEKYNIGKLTESVVASTILLQPEYKEASEAYIKASYEFNMAKYAVQAINDRKDALENLVKLHGMQYFAGPSVPRDLNKEWEEKQKQKKADSKIKMRRERRKVE